MYARYKKDCDGEDEVPEGDYDYDLIVIGGGSGGMAAAKEAAQAGKKVACLDFVKPSPQGTTWDIGGSCVNVGCIPDKLMHYAALHGKMLQDAPSYGWKIEEQHQHSWVYLKDRVQKYLAGLTKKFHAQLKALKVDFINAYGQFIGPHQIKATDSAGNVAYLTSRYFLLAAGGRPRYPNVPGMKEHCISSDDLFSLPYYPNRTLTLGGSFVSLELAEFMSSLGMDVTVMTRSILLRGFDQQMAEIVGRYMSNHGVRFIRPAVPKKVEKLEDGRPGKYRVTMLLDNGTEHVENYNTVLVAIGREPATAGMGLDKVGVKLTETGHVVHTDDERTTCPYIYAVGDILAEKPDMAPTAAQAGKLLMKRLFASSKMRMYYKNVPVAIFGSLEYGCVGLSEEAAIAQYGEHDIEVYHSYFQPLEWAIPSREENVCYAKLICVISENERVVGFHMTGPNAAEITQGFTLGLNLGATKADFDKSVGIHPTCAEIFTLLEVTKRSGMTQQRVGAEVKPCTTGFKTQSRYQAEFVDYDPTDPMKEGAKRLY